MRFLTAVSVSNLTIYFGLVYLRAHNAPRDIAINNLTEVGGGFSIPIAHLFSSDSRS
jgi:hypothetical protein